MITTRVLTGADLDRALGDVARLRINVFRAFPYLYDGDLAYEEQYLQIYRESEDAVLVGAFDGDVLVGASTGMPLEDHADDFGAAFEGTDLVLSEVFYCAESVLLPQYRGHGVGHAFFDLREAHARKLGDKKVCFCGVVRPVNHPMRPNDYAPLDPFWRKRGYKKLDGAIAEFGWKDIGHSEETKKQLQFWVKDL